MSLQIRSTARGRPDFKAVYRKLEKTLDRIEKIENIEEVLSRVIEHLVGDFRDDLGFEGGRLYQREEDAFVLCCGVGRSVDAHVGYRIPAGYPPLVRVVREGLIIMGSGDPGFDERIEGPIGVSKFAAISVGENASHVISFTIKGEINEDHILYSLNAVRHVINLKLRQQHFAGIMEEARVIQEGLLPAGPPRFEGYDIDGRSQPTEIVGGDAFDYLHLSDSMLGVAIADASGHGLPAALLARDVITGLRVGMTADLKITRAIERLNRVIHQSALSSKFVSLFYGELEASGNFIYCNAGHNPPLLWNGKAFRELSEGGLVLGPNPDAHYVRGYVILQPGDTVVMYTDGITEADGRSGRLFGRQRLRHLVRALHAKSAREILGEIFRAVAEFAAGTSQRDDMTAVIIRKT